MEAVVTIYLLLVHLRRGRSLCCSGLLSSSGSYDVLSGSESNDSENEVEASSLFSTGHTPTVKSS